MFRDRTDAGRRLADALRRHLATLDDALPGPPPATVVVALPRGGVPVGAEVADALGARLDVVIVRKLGLPGRPELAMGAIGEGGVRVLDPRIVDAADVDEAEIADVERRERAELSRRATRFRDRPPIDLAGCRVVVVDDGVATGSTAQAACLVARALGAASIVMATPVAPDDWVSAIGDAADEYVAVETPFDFRAVGQAYEDFAQVSDDEVVALLDSRRGDRRCG